MTSRPLTITSVKLFNRDEVGPKQKDGYDRSKIANPLALLLLAAAHLPTSLP